MSHEPSGAADGSFDVVSETRAHLTSLAERFPDAPREQMRALHLLGVEREQIVAVSYREDVLRERIRDLPVDDEVRSLVRHAMRWVWKEEQMHTVFVRGALLRHGSWWLRLVTFVQQLNGAIAGWSTAVLHHVKWHKAPISRFWAHVFTFIGFVIGKVPRPVLRELREVSFRDYCRFSIAAEQTAAMCWERVAELGREAGDDLREVAPYEQMARDERNHEQIFQLLLDALDPEGRLREGWSADRIAERLAALGDFYLPPALRPGADTMPLGRGGDVVVATGTDGGATLAEALTGVGFEALLEERARAMNKRVDELVVAIKPTFMRGYSLRDPSSYTDPQLVRGLARAAKEAGCRQVTVLEAASIYDWYFDNRDVASVAQYLGYAFPEAEVVDVLDDVASHRFMRGMGQARVSASWRDADVRIAFGKLTSHPVDQIYLSFAQLECLVPRAFDFVFVERQAHRGQSVATIAGEFPPHLALIDAHAAVADGLLGVIACPRPKSPQRIYAGRDALSVDVVAARHVGEEVEDSDLLSDALQWFDDPRGRIRVVGCDEPIAGWKSPTHNEWSAILSLLSYPVYMLLSGRGTLFVPEMDECAFPPVEPPGFWLRTTRRVLRWMLRTRLPKSR